MRIEIELDQFRSDAGQAEIIERRLRGALKGTEEAAKNAGDGIRDMSGEVSESSKAFADQIQAIAAATRKLISFLGIIAGSNALQKFTLAISDANDQLGFLSKRLGMAARDIKGVDAAVAALGGSGASATSTLKNLNQGIQEMVLMGNDALIPFFGALGVGVVDASGRIREMDDVLLDMADSLSKMDPQQAYALASAMGLDEGVANTLIQGRDAMQEMIDLQKKAYVSSEAEIRISRELGRAQAFLSAQWEGLKTILANALIPSLLKMTKVVSGWFDYLARNERTVRNLFEGLAIAIGVVLLPILIKAGLAMLALISPILGTAAVVAILAAGFAVLYDDYKTWASGGKSLFDWEKFNTYIKNTNFSVGNLAKGFSRLLTGYDSLADAQKEFSGWLKDNGIIDENGVSVRGLANAFKQLGRDIYDSIPALKTMVELLGAVMEGRWSDALDLAKAIPSQMAGTLLGASSAAAGRAAEAIDTMAGKDPDSDGSITSATKDAFQWLKNNLPDWIGAPDSSGNKSSRGKSRNMPSASGLTPPPELAQEFEKAAARHGVPVEAVIALAHQESRFDPNAVGSQTKWGKARGIMQYLDPTAKSLGIDPLNPAQAIDAAAMQLRQRLDAGESMEDAFKHHHAGPNRALWGEKTANYSSEVSGKMSAIAAQRMTRNAMTVPAPGNAISPGSIDVSIASLTVQTSASTLPDATKEGVIAGISRSNELLNQLGGGM